MDGSGYVTEKMTDRATRYIINHIHQLRIYLFEYKTTHRMCDENDGQL